MRTPPLILALALAVLPAVAGGSADRLDLAFLPPAEGGPTVDVEDAPWILVLFAPETDAEGVVGFPGPVQWTTYTATGAWAWSAQTGNVSYPGEPVAGTPTQAVLSGPLVQAGLGSLYLEADRITWTGDQSSSRVASRQDGHCLSVAVEPLAFEERWGRFEAMCPDGGPSFTSSPALATPSAGALGIQLAATGVRVIESHGTAFSCPSACPDGDDRRTTEVGTSGAQQRELRYHRMDGAAGTVSFAGRAIAVYSGGASATVSGSMRFPLADADACPGCLAVQDQTLRVDGTVRLDGLRANADGTMSATVSGHLIGARVDEAAVSTEQLLGVGAAVATAGAAAVGLLVLVKSLLLPLFTRLGKDRALEHPRREAAYQFIQGNPGATFGDIASHVGMAAGPAHHHLAILERSRLVVRRAQGRSTRFFQAEAPPGLDWSHATTLRDRRLRHLLALIESKPGTTQKELLATMEAEGWARSTTQHRLTRLVRAGLVAANREGRIQRYTTVGSPAVGPGLTTSALGATSRGDQAGEQAPVRASP